MRQETRAALRLLVEKAHRLRDGRYVGLLQERGGTKLSYSFKRGENGTNDAIAVDHSRPDDDATDALVLTFRYFIQDNETPSFRWLATHVLDDPGLSDEWKQQFIAVRDQLNTFLDQQSGCNERVVDPSTKDASGEPRLVGEYQWANRQIMEVFIYGGMAHANPKKREIYARWRSNPLGFPFMQAQFDTIIMAGLNAIAYVCSLSERELGLQAGISV